MPWEQIPSNAGIVGMGVTLLKDKVLCVGGLTARGGAAGGWVFSPFRDDGQKWVEAYLGDSMPPLLNPFVVSSDKQLVILGGYKKEVLADEALEGELFD